MNQVALVGRLASNPEIRTVNNRSRTYFPIAVQRPFKNQDGEYEADFISVVLWNGIAENACEYCAKGDLIGVKGRLQTNNYEKDGKMVYLTEVIAEKISFLSGKRSDVKADS